MPSIAIDCLRAHPNNANRMLQATFEKLCNHIRQTGWYPPIIVRPHPVHDDCFEILDGHHRVEALRSLGHVEAHCDIWPVHEQEQADTLLLTLNRLRGEDDPQKRGMILARLRASVGHEDLARRVPDDAKAIRALIDLQSPPPAPVPPAPIQDMPHPVTFFLTALQRKRLLAHLSQISTDRTEALVRLLALNEP